MFRSMAAARSFFLRRFATSTLHHHHHRAPHPLHQTSTPFPTSPIPFINELPLPQIHRFLSSHSSIEDSGFDTEDGTSPLDETQMEFTNSVGIGGESFDFDPTHNIDSVGIGDESFDFDPTHVVDSVGIEGPGSGLDEKEGDIGSNDGIDEVDIVKLEGVLSLLQSSVDGSLESSLDRMDLVLSEDFVMRVLGTRLIPEEHLIRFLRWAIGKDGFVTTASELVALISAIGEGKRDVYAVWDLIKEIGEKEKGALDANVLNGLITVLSRLGKCKAALEVFDKFEEFGCVPNNETYYLCVEGLCRRKFYDWAWLVCQKMLNAGMLVDGEKIGKIVALLCKGNKAKEAYSIYVAAKENSQDRPVGVIHTLIGAMSKVDETVNLALTLLDDFSSEARRRAIVPFTNVVSGLCRIKDIDGAKGLLSKMIEGGPPPGNSVFNLIINALSKAGELDEAMKLLRLMESRGLKPNDYTYCAIMRGYSQQGLMDEACKVFSEAKQKHNKLSRTTYHSLIRAYCKLDEFDEALKLLSEMEVDGVQPNVDEYNKLIQSLCLQALDWKTAERLHEVMKQKGLRLPSITAGLIQAVKELQLEATNSEVVSVAA